MPATVIRKTRKPIEQPIAPPPPRIDPDNERQAEAEDLANKSRAKQYVEAVEKRAKKSTHGPLPEALNNTTTPGGIAANDPDVDYRWQEEPEGAIVPLDVDTLVRHPDNRLPTEQDVLAMVQRLTERGQLEPIVAWSPPDSWRKAHKVKPDQLVVISGETRLRAAMILGLDTLQGRIAAGLTPAEALELLAAYNGERKDLDPIQKARLVQRLCTPVDEGGAGLTRQKAAERVGVDTGATASNLVRLLELPKEWLDRVASGDLAWTWAREIVPYVRAKVVMKVLEADWKSRDKDFGDGPFTTRQHLIDTLSDTAFEELENFEHAPFDTSDPALREKLGVIELPSTMNGQKTTLFATNTELFQKLRQEANDAKAKKQAEKAGRDDKPAKDKPLSPADEKRHAEEKAEQLAGRIQAWRHKLLRRALALLIYEGHDSGLRVVLAFACHPPHRGPGFEMCVNARSGVNRIDTWGSICGFRREQQEERIKVLAIQMLSLESKEKQFPVFDLELIEKYAKDLEIDVAAAWQRIQGPFDVRGPQIEREVHEGFESLLEEFFLLHQTDQLLALGKELGVYLETSKNRQAMVKLLVAVPRGTTRRLPLPKSIKPVAGVGKSKAPAKVNTKPAKRTKK